MSESIYREPTDEEIAEAAAWDAGAYDREVAAVEASRQGAYMIEADPLFFQWQAGEGTEEAWKAKRAEIRERYPYPEK